MENHFSTERLRQLRLECPWNERIVKFHRQLLSHSMSSWCLADWAANQCLNAKNKYLFLNLLLLRNIVVAVVLVHGSSSTLLYSIVWTWFLIKESQILHHCHGKFSQNVYTNSNDDDTMPWCHRAAPWRRWHRRMSFLWQLDSKWAMIAEPTSMWRLMR